MPGSEAKRRISWHYTTCAQLSCSAGLPLRGSCVTLGQSPVLSEPQFPHLKNGGCTHISDETLDGSEESPQGDKSGWSKSSRATYLSPTSSCNLPNPQLAGESLTLQWAGNSPIFRGHSSRQEPSQDPGGPTGSESQGSFLLEPCHYGEGGSGSAHHQGAPCRACVRPSEEMAPLPAHEQ